MTVSKPEDRENRVKKLSFQRHHHFLRCIFILQLCEFWHRRRKNMINVKEPVIFCNTRLRKVFPFSHIASPVVFHFSSEEMASQVGLKICFVVFFTAFYKHRKKYKQASTVDVEARRIRQTVRRLKGSKKKQKRVTRSGEEESQNRQVKNVSPGNSKEKIYSRWTVQSVGVSYCYHDDSQWNN